MSEIIHRLDQKVAAYERHCNAMNDRTTPTRDFNDALNALKILDRDAKEVRTEYLTRFYRRGES